MAKHSSNSTIDRKGGGSAKFGALPFVKADKLGKLGLDASTSNSFEGKGAAGNENQFAGTITVTDVLPSGLKYVADSARFDGQQLEPTIQNDAPAKGLTTLTWKLENRTPFLGVHSAAAAQPPLTYQARTSQTLLDGTKLRNDVATSGGEYDAAADCTYVVGKGFGTCVKSAFAEVTVQTPPGFVLEKSSTQNSISPGDDFDYSISFAS